MSGSLGFSAQALLVLMALREQPPGWCHGYALARQTGLKSGTLYPIVIRLADAAEPPARAAARAARTGRVVARAAHQ